MKKTLKNILLLLCANTVFSQTFVKDTMAISNGTIVSVLDELSIEAGAELINNGTLFLFSHIDNEGTFSHTLNENTGDVVFNGVSQRITGNGINNFNNISFNNTTTFLRSDIQINKEANFTKGIVNNATSGSEITFNELSSSSNASDASYINGTVTKIGELPFNFPIGNETTYRRVSIENLTASNSFSSTYYSENSDGNYSHDKKSGAIKFIDTSEYWEITQNFGDDLIVIEFERNSNTSSSEIMDADISELHVVRWDFEKEFWIDESAIINDEGNALKTVVNIAGYGVFALAIIDAGVVFEDDLIIYNNLTPNGDGKNDFLLIDGIENFPDNTVTIVNRDGVAVAEIKGYDNKEKVFRGYAKGGSSILLPSATYFYMIEYVKNDKAVKKIDYLYINGK